MTGDCHVRFLEGCALQAHEIQLPEMAVAVELSQLLRTESCVVVRQRSLRSVDRKAVGRNESKRRNSPEIDRGGSSRPYLSMGKAIWQGAFWRVSWCASGVVPPACSQRIPCEQGRSARFPATSG